MKNPAIILPFAFAVCLPLAACSDDNPASQVSTTNFVYTTASCNPKVAPETSCVAAAVPTTVTDLIHGGNVTRFIQKNKKVLPENVGADTILPAYTFYLAAPQ